MPIHRLIFYFAFTILAACLGRSPSAAHEEPDLGALFQERLSSVVVIEFFVETEIDRRPFVANGVAVDEEGLVIMPEDAIPAWVPIQQLKEFRAYQLGSSRPYGAEYLGADRVKGWRFVRVAKSLAERLTPISAYEYGKAAVGKKVWGIGIAPKNFDFTPYLMTAEVSSVEQLPDEFGFATTEVTSPGSLVFYSDGRLAGWGSNSLSFERYLTIEGKRYHSYMKIPDQTSTFISAETLWEYIGTPPDSPDANDLSWLGAVGLDAIEDEVAPVMGVEGQSAIAVSRILENSPAAEAGLRDRDIIVGIDGKMLPRFISRPVVVSFFEQEILKREIGDIFEIEVVRSGRRETIKAVLGAHPKMVRQAKRAYFEDLGLTVREFVASDEISLRMDSHLEGDETGVVSFIRMNSPARAGGLKIGDVVLEIDGEPVGSYAGAVEMLGAIERVKSRQEFVVLVARGPETSIIRIALK